MGGAEKPWGRGWQGKFSRQKITRQWKTILSGFAVILSFFGPFPVSRIESRAWSFACLACFALVYAEKDSRPDLKGQSWTDSKNLRWITITFSSINCDKLSKHWTWIIFTWKRRRVDFKILVNITADTNNELTVNELSGYRVIPRSPDRAWDGYQLRLSPRQSRVKSAKRSKHCCCIFILLNTDPIQFVTFHRSSTAFPFRLRRTLNIQSVKYENIKIAKLIPYARNL